MIKSYTKSVTSSKELSKSSNASGAQPLDTVKAIYFKSLLQLAAFIR